MTHCCAILKCHGIDSSGVVVSIVFLAGRIHFKNVWSIGNFKLPIGMSVNVCICEPCERLVTCPGCTRPFQLSLIHIYVMTWEDIYFDIGRSWATASELNLSIYDYKNTSNWIFLNYKINCLLWREQNKIDTKSNWQTNNICTVNYIVIFII